MRMTPKLLTVVVVAAMATACDQEREEKVQVVNRVDPVRRDDAPLKTAPPASSDDPDFVAVVPEGVGARYRRQKELRKLFDEAAETGINRLSPYDFAEVPIEVREMLVEMGCTIPQIPDDWPGEKPMNVISGEFAVKGQDDWAALCSRDGGSAIIVLWGGDVNCPSVAEAPRPDRGYLQTGGPPIVDGYATGVIFSRAISTIPPDIPALHTIDEVYRMKGDERLPDVRTHDAINDYFLGKAGSALYCHDGKWIEFATSD